MVNRRDDLGRFGVGRHHREYRYTVLDVAKAAKCSVRVVRYGVRVGLLDLNDLRSVVNWVSKRKEAK